MLYLEQLESEYASW